MIALIWSHRNEVSPGFTPRPSLSAPRVEGDKGVQAVSPGFTPRPSLSAADGAHVGLPPESVAGVHAPAFVERAVAVRRW